MKNENNLHTVSTHSKVKRTLCSALQLAKRDQQVDSMPIFLLEKIHNLVIFIKVSFTLLRYVSLIAYASFT